MTNEEKIREELQGRFNDLKDAIVVQRDRRLLMDVPLEKFQEVFNYLATKAGFGRLLAITGLDEGVSFGVIYHLGQEEGMLLSLRTHIDRQKPIIKTVTSYFPAADIYERELVDLLGIEVLGLAPGLRYPLPDNWPADGGYPLRKDWKGVPGEEKKQGGVHE